MQIVALFEERSESAISETQKKYGNLVRKIAGRILPDARDVEECISDAYMRLWNAIPPNSPHSLGAFLARITRNLAVDKYHYNHAEMRSTALTSAFDELEAFLPARSAV